MQDDLLDMVYWTMFQVRNFAKLESDKNLKIIISLLGQFRKSLTNDFENADISQCYAFFLEWVMS